ncbi:MAG TPA: hypothetical protein VIE39_03350, partial [Thermoanaerobaculia bacterium]
AGACGGMSVLFKITGAYYIAAAILFLLYEETSSAVPESARTVRWPLALRIVATGALLAAVTSTIRTRLAPMETLHFLVPTLVLCLLVVRKELLSPMPAGRWSRHVRRLGLLALGILVPIAAYGIFIGLTEISAMLASLRHSISRQLSTPKASRYLPALRDVWPALPYMSLLGFGPYVRANRTVTRALFVAAGLLALAPILLGPAAYKVEWLSARSLAPAVVLVGGALLWRTARDVPREREVEVFLFLALAGMVSLVQVPFSAPIYFCYVAPLVALAAAAVAGGWSRPLAVLHAGVGLFYLVFAVYRMNPGYLFQLGERPQAYVADARLTMPRGQLIVPKAEADLYNALVAAIRTRSRGNDLWAGPDCPEIYFLAERRNPERWFYGFQNPLYRDDAALLRRLDEPRFRVLVIQHHPGFSARYSPGLREEMARRFPGSAEFGGFTLRWRDGF